MAEPQRVLVIDDEETICHLLAAVVVEFGYQSDFAGNAKMALAKLREGDFDVVLCDVNMPGIDGFEVVRRIRADESISDVRVIQVTGISDQEARLEAVRAGADDFIAKPVDFTELQVRLEAQLKIKAQQDIIKRHKIELEETVEQRTAQLQEALRKTTEAEHRIRKAYLETIRRLAVAAEYKDAATANHIDRVGRYAAVLARGLGLPEAEVETIRHASPMHDVGKLGIPDSILLNPGKLSDEEWATMKTHTLIGGRILADSDSELIEAGRVIALSHHEKWDGSGYPNGLSGTEIHLYGRICALADVFDALTTARTYKDAFPNERAYAIIRDSNGSHFDPQLVDIFFGHLAEIEAIQAEYAPLVQDGN